MKAKLCSVGGFTFQSRTQSIFISISNMFCGCDVPLRILLKARLRKELFSSAQIAEDVAWSLIARKRAVAATVWYVAKMLFIFAGRFA